MKTSFCLNCKKEIKYDESKSFGKYCNNTCQGIFTFNNITIPKIESNNCSQSVTLKKYLQYKRGYKCEICNISNWKNKDISLHLDHIDGNSDNNYPNNIRLLCPNCHSQTETYCSRNRKNSKRSLYKKRYRIKNLNLTNTI
jgi:hypothetical protein